jgi:hypothetical protein
MLLVPTDPVLLVVEPNPLDELPNPPPPKLFPADDTAGLVVLVVEPKLVEPNPDVVVVVAALVVPPKPDVVVVVAALVVPPKPDVVELSAIVLPCANIVIVESFANVAW